MSELVSTNWLYNNLNLPNLIILDCTWYMPLENRNSKKEYQNKHIKNSFFFDINKISNTKSKLPHMLPSTKIFEKKIKKFGIFNSTKIIAYSSNNILGAARVWWMFKYFGHKKISILDGGLKKWLKEKKPITKEKSIIKEGCFKSKINKELVVNYKQVLEHFKINSSLIIDARNANRFNGTESEPRKKLRSGHIPKSKNLFWCEFLNKNGTLLSKEKILKKCKGYIKEKKKIIISCGSGISACVISLSLLHSLGIQTSVYDGSWAEWGQKKMLPIEK